MTLWCPQLAAKELQILHIVGGNAYPDITALVRDQIARFLALSAATTHQ